jgi:hypothetical protein
MIAPLKTKSLRWPAPMVPLWIAESVCAEAARFLGEDLPARYAEWLAARAERCYRGIAHFRRSMQARGTGGRDNLRMFMRHWLASLLLLERPDLYRALPPAFDLGLPLPPGTRPRVNHRSSLPLPKALAWNPDRVLQHRHWRFLAAPSPASSPVLSRTRGRTTTRTKARRAGGAPGVLHAAVVEFPIC